MTRLTPYMPHTAMVLSGDNIEVATVLDPRPMIYRADTVICARGVLKDKWGITRYYPDALLLGVRSEGVRW